MEVLQMSDTISQSEAEELISMLKKSLIDLLYIPDRGKSKDFEVVGESTKNKFIIHIHRGGIKNHKINYNARIKSNNVTLLELHLNPTNVHVNPDGEKFTGSHWHIYRERYGHKWALPADDITSDDFIENTIKFLERFHVIKKPEIIFQEEL